MYQMNDTKEQKQTATISLSTMEEKTTKIDTVIGSALFGANRPKETGTPYTSAGGGEVYFNPSNLLGYVWNYVKDERARGDSSGMGVSGPDLHMRPPQWMEDKNVSIDGTPLTEEELRAPNFWQTKYKRELDIGEAVQEVKRTRRTEATHDIVGSISWLGRKLGWSEPLDEQYARKKVEERYRLLGGQDTTGSVVDEATTGQKIGVATPWKVLLESVETGRPVAKVANERRLCVDFYGVDHFFDARLPLIWFTTKCGIAVGIIQGSLKAIQAVNVDVQFLKASGVGILSILNMSVFASVVKWGGNCALFSTAFCFGDSLATSLKYFLLPPHDARQRSILNYSLGFAMSGSTVGILPWWILSDMSLAFRLSVSGAFVGGILGLAVGTVMRRLVILNTTRLEATNRELRRYEALMRRQRCWVEEERLKATNQRLVWW
ncbi:hypothetical protein DPX39_040052300 [Trypanosoma brucei equiperdum]|uniref:Transmembrane protein n=1 Tax=Trypanosoma brucei equiperdum TaxID=630700 RepID=A0A3L6L9B2_9TRYP|nr:hypothetical protein DPX39_040052300 [Trypanosoma brucei equiperdum]